MARGIRILFMGTPEFAVASLGSLLMNNYNVVGVVTSPDKPSGRGQKISQSAVARYATENYLNLIQPTSLKDPSFIKEIKALEPDIAVVVAFRMLPEEIWSLPVLGTFNLHASLLPQYRGAAPINWAIINGESSTGVTTFFIDDKIDTGNIILRKELSINHSENAGELHDRLMRSGAKLVVRTVKLITSGRAKAINQDKFLSQGEVLKPAPKIFPKDCYINWSGRTEDVNNQIRGLSPYPGARTLFRIGEKNILIKILESKPVLLNHNEEPGTIIDDGRDRLNIYTMDGYIEIISIQPEGKRAMRVADYLRGINRSSIAISKAPQV